MNKFRFLTLIFLVIYCGIASAGFDESIKALQVKSYETALIEARKGAEKNDPRAYFLLGEMYLNGWGVDRNSTEAFSWYEKAAKGGVLVAFSKLAMAYSRGDGVAKDKDKALSFARFAAKNSDPEGLFLVYIFLQNLNLSYLDSNGRVDDVKYRNLASRALSERTVDTDALDSLYLSVNKAYPLAVSMLALNFGGRVGDGNRKKMDELLQRLPVQTKSLVPGLQVYEKISSQMASLGESYATPQLFADSQSSGMLSAMIKACGLDKDKAKKSIPKLTSTRVTKPFTDAIYLPSNVSGYEHAYLIWGNWEEEWQYEACDKTVVVNMRFVADGLGGATYLSEQSVKNTNGSSQ